LSRIKLLLINYLFPPAGGIAVQRALSLAKYLPACGFEVHVLSAGNAAAPVMDPDLLRHVHPEVILHRSFTPELPFAVQQKLWGLISPSSGGGSASAPSLTAAPRRTWKSSIGGAVKRLLTPDPQVVWVPFALRKARRVIKEHGIQAVLVTVPPFSTLLASNALKREVPGIVLITDFRDEWLSFYLKDFSFQSDDWNRRRAEQIERETVETSDLVVAVTPTSLDKIRGRYPEQPDGKFACVYNGYDPDVFGGFRPRKHDSAKIVVTHMGTVYKTASPRFYLDALDDLPEELRSRVETRFIGRISDEERRHLEARKSPVRVLGFMPQAEALRWCEETDYLLLTMTNDISLPGKLFEYLAMQKPLLAISPLHGEVGRILARTRAGWCVEPGDSGGIQDIIRRACDTRDAEGGRSPDLDAVRAFERRRLAEQYGDLIRQRVESLLL
jgi:glycosyltransferase involved in cell wall biosynthesis